MTKYLMNLVDSFALRLLNMGVRRAVEVLDEFDGKGTKTLVASDLYYAQLPEVRAIDWNMTGAH